MDCSPPGSSVHGIFQGRVLEWVAIAFFSEDQQDLLKPKPTHTHTHTHTHKVLYIIVDWNTKIGSQGILGVTGKFSLGVQNEAGQSPIEYYQENTLVIVNTIFKQHKRNSTHGLHQMINTKIRLIILFVAKDGEALYI